MLPSNRQPLVFHFAHRSPWVRPFLIGMLAGVALAAVPWARVGLIAAKAAREYQQRREQRRALAPLVYEAQRLGLTYEQVAAAPAELAGKNVYWCVDHPSRGVSFLAGRPSQPLAWANEDEVPSTGPKGHCVLVLAAVEGAGASGVQLRFIGEP